MSSQRFVRGGRSWCLTLCITLAAALAAAARATASEPTHVVAWMEPEAAPRPLAEWAEQLVRSLTDYVFRATSPDVERSTLRLWVLDPATRQRCLYAPNRDVREPRWGRGGMLFISDIDSNGDGVIDRLDEPMVRLIERPGRPARNLRPGRSAAWSPDGQHVAILHGGKAIVVDLQGKAVDPATAGLRGRLVLADSRSATRTLHVWALDLGTGRTDEIESGMARKMLWLSTRTPDGKLVVFSNAQRTDLFVGDPAIPADAENVTRDGYIDFDPTWSIAGRRIVYVSNYPADGPECR